MRGWLGIGTERVVHAHRSIRQRTPEVLPEHVENGPSRGNDPGVSRAAIVAVIAALVTLASAGAAAAAPSTFAVVFVDDEPTVGGGGLGHLYTPRTGPIKLKGNRFEITVEASGGPSQSGSTFEFTAPRMRK